MDYKDQIKLKKIKVAPFFLLKQKRLTIPIQFY